MDATLVAALEAVADAYDERSAEHYHCHHESGDDVMAAHHLGIARTFKLVADDIRGGLFRVELEDG